MADTRTASSSRRWPRSIYPSLLNRRAIIALILVSLVPFIYMCLYMGAFWNPQRYYRNIKVAFINADAGFNYTGVPTSIQAAIKSNLGNQSMGETVRDQITRQTQILFDWDIVDDPSYTYETLYNEINEGTYQFGLYIPKNFSDNYLTAFGTNNSARYHPMTLTYVYDQGRDYSTSTMITTPITRLVSSSSRHIATQLLLAPNAVQNRDSMVPAFWIEPITLYVDTMHPVIYYGQNNASYLSVMVMYIASIAVVTVTRRFVIGDPVVFGYVDQQPNGDIPLKQVEIRDVGTDPVNTEVYNVDASAESEIDLSDDESNTNDLAQTPKVNEKAQPIFSIFHIVTAKYSIMLVAVFLCALLVWVAPLIFGNNQYEGAPAVVALFYLVFVGLCFLNMLNFFCNLFGLNGFSLPAALFMIFMLTTGSAMISDLLSPAFFRIGRGLPFHYAVQGMRFIYFGSLKSQIGLCCGVIVAWMVAALIPGVWAAVRAERIRRGQRIVRAIRRRRMQLRHRRRKMTAKRAEQAEQNV